MGGGEGADGATERLRQAEAAVKREEARAEELEARIAGLQGELTATQGRLAQARVAAARAREDVGEAAGGQEAPAGAGARAAGAHSVTAAFLPPPGDVTPEQAAIGLGVRGGTAVAAFMPPPGAVTPEQAAALLGGRGLAAPAAPTGTNAGSGGAGAPGCEDEGTGGEGGKGGKKKKKKKKKGGGREGERLHGMLDTLRDASRDDDSAAAEAEMRALWQWLAEDRPALEAAAAAADAESLSCLHKAVMLDDPKMRVLHLLLQLGAGVDPRDDEGNTPLVVAPYFAGGAAACALLLDKGADIDAAGSEGNTALMSAAECLNAEALELLVDRGADRERKNAEGKRAIDLCMANNDPDIPQAVKAQCAAGLGGDLTEEELDDAIVKALTCMP